MPNIGGPRSSKRRVLTGAVSSIVLYGAPICGGGHKKRKIPTNASPSVKEVGTEDKFGLSYGVNGGGAGPGRTYIDGSSGKRKNEKIRNPTGEGKSEKANDGRLAK